MKEKQIKQIINDSIREETPDFLAKIKSECKNIKQIEPVVREERVEKKSFNFNFAFKKIAFTFAACLIFVFGIVIGNIELAQPGVEVGASIYLDVNPSVEVKVDENKKVIECLASNEDGEKIINNLNLTGVDINTALYAIVGSMYTNGYLKVDANSILISVNNYNSETGIVLNDISEQINNIFKENESMNCSIIAQQIETDVSIEEKSKSYKVSVGKMNLIEKIIKNIGLYTEENIEELAEMSIHELDLIYQSYKENKEEVDKEHFSGAPSGYIGRNAALESVIEYLEITEKDIRSYDIVTLYHRNAFNEREMVYLVTLRLKSEKERRTYVVNCSTGEIMTEDVISEWEDKILNGGHFGDSDDDYFDDDYFDDDYFDDDYFDDKHNDNRPNKGSK